MREPGFDELADLWQRPDDQEQEVFEALARRARRHGRLLAYVDIAQGIIIVGGVALGAFMAPHPTMIAAALLLVALTTVASWQQRKLRQMSSTLNTASRTAFLKSSMRYVTGKIRRATIAIVVSPTGMVLSVLYKMNLRDEHFWEHPLVDIGAWLMSWRALFGFSFMTLLLLWLSYSRRRSRAELRRLQQLERDYNEERQRDGDFFPQEIP
jgi:lysylphosphatidylglycerol synthetase-like protein (DUF2156 family)